MQLNQHDLPIPELNNGLADTIEAVRLVILLARPSSTNIIWRKKYIKRYQPRPRMATQFPNTGLITLEFSIGSNNTTNTTQQRNFYALEQLAHDLILGFPFITDYGDQIDWGSLHESSEQITEAPERIEDTGNHA